MAKKKPPEMQGLFATLTDEQKAKALASDGSENFGPYEYSLAPLPAPQVYLTREELEKIFGC